MTLSWYVGSPPRAAAARAAKTAGPQLSAETGASFGGRTQDSVRRFAILARAGRWTACVVAAAALQAGAWQVAKRVMERETPGDGMPRAAALQVRAIAPQAPIEPQASTPPAGASETIIAPAPPAGVTPVPARAAPSAGDDGSVATQRPFYDYREVDIPAEPVGQWNLEPSALEALATSRIVFTLFVSSDGTVLHCSVDEPERLSREARKSLEARLCETPMRPAWRGGVAVASRRRVELFIVSAG